MRRFAERPVFICGWPRGGTRMIAGLIASHPTIALSGEIPRKAVEIIAEAVEKLDEPLGRKKRLRAQWSLMRQDYFLNCLANTSPKTAERTGSRFCNKTPSMELAWEAITSLCQSERPQFVYCVRHPRQVLKSLANMPWNGATIQENLARLLRSTDALDRLLADGGSVFVSHIDQVSDRDAFSRGLLDFLSLDMTPEVDRYIQRWPTRQPTKDVVETARELTQEETDFLDNSAEYADLCRRFNYEP